jgi:hypothetical protein
MKENDCGTGFLTIRFREIPDYRYAGFRLDFHSLSQFLGLLYLERAGSIGKGNTLELN